MSRTPRESYERIWRMPKTVRLPPSREWVYFVYADCAAPVVKIGRSQEAKWRLLTLQAQSPIPLALIGLVNAPAGAELALHSCFADEHSHCEWFYASERLLGFVGSLPKGAVVNRIEVRAWGERFNVDTEFELARSALRKGRAGAKRRTYMGDVLAR